MINNLVNNFPSGCEPRDAQIKILTEVNEALNKKQKFIIISAPTGTGKSHLAGTLANISKPLPPQFIELVESNQAFEVNDCGMHTYDSIISAMPNFGCSVLTVSKLLQDQYTSLFNNCVSYKGKQNYICAVDPDSKCDAAPCMLTPKLLGQCIEDNTCPYINSRIDALTAKFNVLNYALFLTLPDHLKKREFLVCDEADNFEDELVNYHSFKIEYNLPFIKTLNITKVLYEDPSYIYGWLNDLKGILEAATRMSLESMIMHGKKKSKMQDKHVAQYRFYSNLFAKVQLMLKHWNMTEYVVEFNSESVSLKPLYVDAFTKHIFDRFDHVILMSATIIDHKTFAHTLGINDYSYIEVDSDFVADKSPIYCSEKIKLNYQNIDAALPQLIEMALEVCEHHKDDKGIIHTHTFKINEAVKKQVKGNNRFLFRDDGFTNENILKEHFLRNDATVLVSPSMIRGVDLEDEHGRFQIILKTPFLPLGDKRIKKLFEVSKSWYNMKTINNLIQMCGRCTRNIDDHSETYILDATAVDLIKRNKNKIPLYFLNRIH